MDALLSVSAGTGTSIAPQRHRTRAGDHRLLADGRSVLVRPLSPRDATAEQAFVAALSPMSRYRRFHFGLHELPPPLLRRLTEIDQRRHVALVALGLPAFDEPAIVADARYVRCDDDDAAEFAVAVADDWQRLGLGREMLERLMRHAREHGVSRLCGDVLWDNRPMIAMVTALGGTLARKPGEAGVLRARFTL